MSGTRRVEDWLRQGEAALGAAKKTLALGEYWLSCFLAHQATEAALKALFHSLGEERRGHSLLRLLEGLGAPEDLLDAGRRLDRHYLQSRYVNTFYEGAPIDYYGLREAEEAVKDAEQLLEYCKARLRQG